MIEKATSLEVEETYEKIKRALTEKECKIIVEEPLKKIVAEHGYPSLSPRESWKRIKFYFFPEETGGTRVICSSSIIPWIPIRMLVYLMVFFTYIGAISLLWVGSTLFYIAFFGIILVFMVYETYIHLHRKREEFLEEILRSIPEKQQ